MLPVRPLCSTGITPLLRSYGPLRLPARTAPWLCIPSGRWGPVTLSPPCRVSQVPRLIYPCALSPTTPEGPTSPCSLLPRRYQASSSLTDWPPSPSFTRPNRVRLRYGSQVCVPGFRQKDYSASLRFRYMHERAIYMVNSFQFTRSARLGLVYQRKPKQGRWSAMDSSRRGGTRRKQRPRRHTSAGPDFLKLLRRGNIRNPGECACR
jgi:hypothetical protein